MSIDILESLNSAFTGPLSKQASGVLNEPEADTRSALRSIFPTLLASLMQKTSATNGAAEVYRSVTSDTVDAGITGKLADMIGNRSTLEPLLANGERLSNTLLGNRAGGIAHAIAQVAGIKPGSVTALLSMGAPLLFGFLKKQVTGGGLDAGRLTSLLLDQRSSLERTGLDSRITSALGFESLSSLLGSLPGSGRIPASAAAAAPIAGHSREGKRWLPWAAMAAGLALVAWWGLSNRSADKPRVATARLAQPYDKTTPAPDATTRATDSAAVAQSNSAAQSYDTTQLSPGGTGEAETATATATPSTENMRLASLPASVYFDSGQSNVDSQDRETVSAVAELVKGQGHPVAVTGYTDRTGNPDHNLELARERAIAVKSALIAEGVAESSIVMAPPAVVTGSGGNADARRVEISPSSP